MIKKIVVFVIVVSSMILSCKEDTKVEPTWNEKIETYRDMFDVFNKEYLLKGKVVINDSNNISYIFDIYYVNGKILIKELRTKNFIFKVFDLKSGKYQNGFIKYGKGPFEMISPRITEYSKDSLLIYDPNLTKFYVFSKDKIQDQNGTYDREIFFRNVNKEDKIWVLYSVNDNFISSGEFLKGTLHIFDKRGNFKYNFGKYPKVDAKEIDNLQLGYRYGGGMDFCFNKKKSNLCVSTGKNLLLYNYSYKKKFSLLFNVQWCIEDITTVGYNKKGSPYAIAFANENLAIGLGEMVANDKYIFFTFSKYNQIEEYENGMSNPYGYVFVMDWDGLPICRLKLDKPALFPIQIDEKGENIYTVHVDTTTGLCQVVKYDISNIDKLSEK